MTPRPAVSGFSVRAAKEAVRGLCDVVRREFEKDDGIGQMVDPQVSAVKAIGRIGLCDRDVMTTLIDALDSDYSTAQAAATVLGSIRPSREGCRARADEGCGER